MFVNPRYSLCCCCPFFLSVPRVRRTICSPWWMGCIFHTISLIKCVCVFSSHPFWTSSSLDVPAGVTQEEGHTGFLIHLLSAVRALIFLARRIQPFLSLVDREVEFCVLTISSFSTRWAFLFLFFRFLVRKIPFAGIELTSQRVRRFNELQTYFEILIFVNFLAGIKYFEK